MFNPSYCGGLVNSPTTRNRAAKTNKLLLNVEINFPKALINTINWDTTGGTKQPSQ